MFDHEHKHWYSIATDDKQAHWIADEYFSEPPVQGGIEQLTPTALACWKKENEPETTRTENMHHRKSLIERVPNNQDSEHEEENPFSEEEKEEELEYAPGVLITILTIKQQ